jgi:hypothetical protein
MNQWKSADDRTNDSLQNIALSIVTINNTISLILNELTDRTNETHRSVSLREGSSQTTGCDRATVATQTDTEVEVEARTL